MYLSTKTEHSILLSGIRPLDNYKKTTSLKKKMSGTLFGG